MSKKRLLMRKLREILRLKYEAKLPHRLIGRACCIGAGTVSMYLQRAKREGLSWPLPETLDDDALESKLFREPFHERVARPAPDCEALHRELKRPRGHLATIVVGVPRGAPWGVSLQSVL